MKKSILITALILISPLSFTQEEQKECAWQVALDEIPLNDIVSRDKVCEGLPRIETEAELKDSLEFFFKEAQKKKNNNRHQMTRDLNQCSPTQESKALIIAFEGTGAYEPLIPATMGNFLNCFGDNINPKLKDKIYPNTQSIFRAQEGKDEKWSGLQAGIMSEIALLKNGNHVDWYSFPSEEVEQLAGFDQISNFSLKQLHDSIKDSVASNPEGIKNARNCIISYMTKAKALGIEPKVIVVSHSSGGRSLVKFSEHVKKDLGINIDLAFSIDPVKEAHHAVEEVLPQKLGEPLRYIKWKIKGGDYPYSAVWHRKQPSSLYKPSNVQDHVSFYQLDDRLGLKIGGDALRFGIKGSPMEGADNRHIKGTGMGGHGEITYNPEVLKVFNSKMNELLK